VSLCAAGFHCRISPAPHGVDHRALVRPLPDQFLERGRVGERDPGVPGEQLQQLQFHVPDLAAAVQRVKRAVGAVADVGQGQGDRVQPGQGRPDQLGELTGVAGRHHYAPPGPHELPDQAGGQVGGAAAEPGGEALHADQPHPVFLDQHEPARVGAGQVAQAGGDPVQHSLQVALGVHVRHHVAELADHLGPLGHVVPGRGVLPGAVAHVHPADDLTGAVPQRAGVDAQVQQLAVLAGPAGDVGDLAPGADPLQRGVVLGHEFLGDQRRFLAEDLRGAPAEHPLGRRVPQQHRPLGAERHDGIGRAFDHGTRCRIHAVLARYPRFGSHPCIVPSPAGPGLLNPEARLLHPGSAGVRLALWVCGAGAAVLRGDDAFGDGAVDGGGAA